MVLKKWVAAVTATAVALTSGSAAVLFGTAATAAEPEKTESGKVVEIRTLEELEEFRDDVNNGNDYAGVTVVLTADIDLGGEEWTPIGFGRYYNTNNEQDEDAWFSGVFDGGDHKIEGLYIKNQEIKDEYGGFNNYGLFGTIAGASTIVNLRVSGEIYLTVQDDFPGVSSVGGIVGYIAGGMVDNCYSDCDITVIGGGIVGGIVGYGTCRITRCANAGDIEIILHDAITANGYYVGGIAGGQMYPIEIENCCNTGSITISSESEGEYTTSCVVGGIAGFPSSTITNCYNEGVIALNNVQIDEYSCLGSISGRACTLKGCYYLEGTAEHVCGDYDELSPEDAYLINAEQLANKDTFEGWDFVNIWKMTDERPVLTDSSVHVHNDVAFAPWTFTDHLPVETGINWYLTEDVVIDKSWYYRSGCVYNFFGQGYQKKIGLCLNGHTVTFEDGTIIVCDGQDLSFYDCDSEKKGTVKTCGIHPNMPSASTETSRLTIYNGNFYFSYDSFGLGGFSEITINDGYFNFDSCSLNGSDILTINGGYFIGNNNMNGVVQCGEITEINGGTFLRENDEETDYINIMGIVCNYVGTLTINGGAFGDGRNDVSISNGAYDGGTLNLCNGTVTAKYYGIYNDYNGTVNLFGGSVSGGEYGIYNDNCYSNSECIVNLFGSHKISGGTADIYLRNYYSSYIYPSGYVGDYTDTYINITDELTNEKPYSIGMEAPGVFTDSDDTDLNDLTKFVSTMPGYSVAKNEDGQLELAPADLAVTLDYNDGTGKTDTVTVKYLDFYPELPEPTREGYIFDGWWYTDVGEDEFPMPIYYSTIVITPTDHTVHARWIDESEAGAYLTITLHYQYPEDEDKTEEINVVPGGIYGSKLPVEPVFEGYTFDGWYTEAEGGERVFSNTIVDYCYHLYAHWTKNTEPEPEPEPDPETSVTVTFDYQGADGGDETTEKTVKVGEKYGELPQPTKTGYLFDGWYTAAEGGTLAEADTEVTLDADHILYAHWKECDHSETVVDKAVAATCTENGRTDGEHCAVCGKVLKEQEEIPAPGHSWNDRWELVADPTLTEAGKAERVCTRDISHTERKDVPALSDETVWILVEDYPPTCRIDGGQRYFSYEYGTVDVFLPKLEHQWDEGTVTVQPSQTSDGLIVYTCAVCGETRSESIPALGGSDTAAPAPQPPATTTPAPEPPVTTTPAPEPPVTTTPAPEPPVTTTPAPQPGTTTTPAPAPGSIVSADSGKNAPDVRIDGASSGRLENEVLTRHLTAEEKEAMENGARLEIVVSVEDAGKTVPAAEKSSTEKMAEASGYTVGQYLSIDILKLIDGRQTGKVTQLNTPLSITIDVPEGLRGSSRKFAVVRVHGGETELLADTDSDPRTITISTDRFSTYAIVYQDTADVQVPSGDNTQAPGTSDGNPGTGVHPATELAVLTLAFGGTAALLAVTKLTRKKK